jgi:autoinducer binding domain-containing protein
MPQSFSHGIEALHFIQALKRLGSPSAVIPSMHQAVARHRFENLVFYQPFEDVVLGKHLSEEWTRIYSDYMHYDPIVRHLRRAVRPFEWREITFDVQRYPRAAELVRQRADFGFKAGFIVPIPGVSGTRAMVAMSGSRPELTRRNVAVRFRNAVGPARDMPSHTRGSHRPRAGSPDLGRWGKIRLGHQ